MLIPRFIADLAGTVLSYFYLGTLKLKDNSGTLEVKNEGDTAYASIKGKDIIITSEADFTYASLSPITIATLPIGAIITKITLSVLTAWDNTDCTFEIGIAGTTNKYMTTSEADLKLSANYEVAPNNKLASQEILIATYTAGTTPAVPTAGVAKIIVEYTLK